MKFERPTLFCDPSYTCSGVCLVDPQNKTLEFQGFSRAETKRDLHHYYVAAKELAYLFRSYLERVLDEYPNLDVVMEAPFPGSFASSGLYMLQAYYLQVLKDLPIKNFYSLSPSYVSGQVKKACGKKDGIGIRKKYSLELLASMNIDGWTVKNVKLLKIAGCDPQTAFLFYWFLSTSDKVLDKFIL